MLKPVCNQMIQHPKECWGGGVLQPLLWVKNPAWQPTLDHDRPLGDHQGLSDSRGGNLLPSVRRTGLKTQALGVCFSVG